MDIQQMFAIRTNDLLKEMKPGFIVPERWYDFALKALRFTSPLLLGISAEEMEGLADVCKNKGKGINCYQFALLSNNLESTSSDKLDLELDVYLEFMKMANKLSESWNNQVAEPRAKLEATILQEIKLASERN